MIEMMIITESDDRMYERGVTVAHSSDVGGYPDVGKSVGLGSDRMLYAGERPNFVGWCLCIYPKAGEAIDIAVDIDQDGASDLIDMVSAAINSGGCAHVA